MKYFFVLLLFTFLTTQCSFAEFDFYKYNSQNGYSGYPKISQIESILFKKKYENDDIKNRLSRIERKIFKTSYNNADLSWRTDNIISNMDGNLLYNISEKELSQIELNLLGKNYITDTTEKRIIRLEENLFGAIQNGSLDNRFSTIKNITACNSNNYNIGKTGQNNVTTYQTYNNPTLKNTFRNILGSFLNGGYMTGYTPPITPYNYNNPYNMFPNSGYSHHNTFRDRWGGYHNSNRYFGNGTGFHILD